MRNSLLLCLVLWSGAGQVLAFEEDIITNSVLQSLRTKATENVELFIEYLVSSEFNGVFNRTFVSAPVRSSREGQTLPLVFNHGEGVRMRMKRINDFKKPIHNQAKCISFFGMTHAHTHYTHTHTNKKNRHG